MPLDVTNMQRLGDDYFAIDFANKDRIVVAHRHLVDEAHLQARIWQGVAEVLAKWVCDFHGEQRTDKYLHHLIELAKNQYWTGLEE